MIPAEAISFSDVTRVVLVLVAAGGQALMACWPDLRGWPHTIATRSAALDTPIVPPGWAFAVWGPIFLSSAAFAAYHALPSSRGDPFLTQVGWGAAVLFSLNVLWEALVPRRGLDWTSVAVIAAELAVALTLLGWTADAGLEGARYWLVGFPLQLFAGWVSVAAFVNLSSTMRRARLSNRRGPDPGTLRVSIALLVVAAALCTATVLASGSVAYAVAAAWGLAALGARSTSARPIRIGGAAAAASVLAGAFAAGAAAEEPSNHTPLTDEVIAVTTPSPTSMPTHETTRTSDLDIAFLKRGPDRPAEIVFVHGFPDDAASWLPVMDALAEFGVASAAPWLRGFGPTTFRSPDTPRSGQLAALVSDLSSFLDAAAADRVTLVGHDWGARAAQGVAATEPDRVGRLVSYGGYAIAFGGADGPPPYPVLQALWYQHLLNMPFADAIVEHDREGLARHLWSIWSPGWAKDERSAALSGVLPSLANPDFGPVVLSGYSYTGRGHDERLADLERRLARAPAIGVPSVVIRGGRDPLETPEPFADDASRFTDLVRRLTLDDVGHFAHRQDPDALVELLVERKR